MTREILVLGACRIHPTIEAGRVRHETGNWRLLSSVKADVRRLFADQLQELAQRA